MTLAGVGSGGGAAGGADVARENLEVGKEAAAADGATLTLPQSESRVLQNQGHAAERLTGEVGHKKRLRRWRVRSSAD